MGWPGPLEKFYDALVALAEKDWEEIKSERRREYERRVRDNGPPMKERGHTYAIYEKERDNGESD